MTSFNELKLSDTIIKALEQMGFEEATHIQELTIPAALKGKDIIGQARTGTGKTAAFGIVLAEKCDTQSGHIQGIVITPTRELTIQVAGELNRIGHYKGIRALPIYGGQSINIQVRELKSRPQIIVGTPGRLLDHMTRKKTISLRNINVVVLDEADEMLDMGFIEDIEEILSETPSVRQTMLFSATIPAPVRALAQKFMKDPVSIGVTARKVTASDITQSYTEVQDKQKFEALCRFLDIQSPEHAIVFCRTKKRVDEVSEALSKRGYSALGLHGDLDQSMRDRVMRRFREGNVQALVATDVAARGLDIRGVTHVYNFDIPRDAENYVHRIGRTGRAGNSGQSITFVTPRENRLFRMIEEATGQRATRLNIPTMSDAIEGQQRIAIEKLLCAMESDDVLKYRTIAEALLDEHDPIRLLSAALKMLIKEPDTTPVELTEIVPARVKSGKYHNKGQVKQGRKDKRYGERRDGYHVKDSRNVDGSGHRRHYNKGSKKVSGKA